MPLDETRTAGEAGHLSDHNNLHVFYNDWQLPFSDYLNGQVPKWNDATQQFEPGNDNTSAGASQFEFAEELYVRPDAPNDGGNGRSWANAKRTIQGAINVANSGATIHLAPGVHNRDSFPVTVADKHLWIVGKPFSPRNRNTDAGWAVIRPTSVVQDALVFDFAPGSNNLYGGGVSWVHFDAGQVTRSGVFWDNTNLHHLEYCRFFSQGVGNEDGKTLLWVEGNAGTGAADASWNHVRYNLVRKAQLLRVTHSSAGFNAWRVEHNDIGFLPNGPYGTTAAIFFNGSDVSGQTSRIGRATIAHNKMEGFDPVAIEIEGGFDYTIIGNKFEHIGDGSGNRYAIRMSGTRDSFVVHDQAVNHHGIVRWRLNSASGWNNENTQGFFARTNSGINFIISGSHSTSVP